MLWNLLYHVLSSVGFRACTFLIKGALFMAFSGFHMGWSLVGEEGVFGNDGHGVLSGVKVTKAAEATLAVSSRTKETWGEATQL